MSKQETTENKLDKEEISLLIRAWVEIKKNLQTLQEKERKIKHLLGKALSDYNAEKFKSASHTVSRKSFTRRMISKSSVPSDIFDRYSYENTVEYIALTNNTRERSRSRSKKNE